MKFVWLLILAVIAWKLFIGRWPWQPGARTLRMRAQRHARDLLGVSSGANRETILAAHKRLVATVHPDRGGRNEDVHEANAARDVLLETPVTPSQEKT